MVFFCNFEKNNTMTKKERYELIINYFKKNKPIAETELNYTNPFNLLVAVILSAQCTDKRVNVITPALINAYPDANKMATAEVFEIFEFIKTCSYPNNKAKHLVGMAEGLIENFGGKIPDNIKDLQTLPGVGRKTANVIISVVFNKPAMAVDTHVFRVSDRLGLTTNAKNVLETEMQLVKNISPELLPIAHHWLILHGRYVCLARKPKCNECELTKWCKYFSKVKKL